MAQQSTLQNKLQNPASVSKPDQELQTHKIYKQTFYEILVSISVTWPVGKAEEHHEVPPGWSGRGDDLHAGPWQLDGGWHHTRVREMLI
jgi:hypothetical protein